MTIPPDKSPDSISLVKPPLEPTARPVPQQPMKDFDSYMEGAQTPPAGQPTAPATAGPSPIELARGTTMQTAGPSFNSLLAQAKNAQDSLGAVQDQLTDPNLKLKRAQSHLVRNKLSDAQGYIRQAGNKIGVDAPDFKPPTGGAVERFVAYANDGQEQLVAVQTKLQEMLHSGQPI